MGSCEGLRGDEEHGGFPRFPAIPETFITKRVRGHSSITTYRFLNFDQMMAFSWPGNYTWP